MYTTQSDIEAKLGRSLTTSETSYFTDVLDSFIDTYINNETETEFASQTQTTVYVSGNGTNLVTTPTIHAVTEVKTLNEDGSDAETLTEDADYRLYPRVGADVYALRRINGEWPEGTENIKISCNYGFNDVPAEIVHAATEIATGVFSENVNNYKSEKVGDWQVTYADVAKDMSPEVTGILASYRRLSRDI